MTRLLFPIVLLATLVSSTSADAPPRPNILFLYADDLGCGELKSYGQMNLAAAKSEAVARLRSQVFARYKTLPVERSR